MKKFRNFFLMAAAILVGFSSCNNDENVPEVENDEPKSLAFRITLPTPRAAGPEMGAEPVVFNEGTLYLVTNLNGTVVDRITITDDPTALASGVPGGNINIDEVVVSGWGDGGGAATPNGVVIQNIPASVNAAILVGNTASNVAKGSPAANIRGQQLNVLTQSDIEDVNLFAENTFRLANANEIALHGRPEQTLMVAELALVPTVSRIEVHNVVGNEWIASFKVEGIFIDEYWETGTVGAVQFTTHVNRANGLAADVAAFTGTGFAFDTDFAVHDWYGNDPLGSVMAPWTQGSVTGNKATVTPTPVAQPPLAPLVWGYNLHARVSAGTIAVPHIIIRLNNVMVYPGKLESGVLVPDTGATPIPHPHHTLTGGVPNNPLFVTITGFVDRAGAGNSRITSFDAGRVFKLGADGHGWSFGPDNVHPVPDPQEDDLLVLVTVASWQVVNIDPEMP